MRYEVEVAGAFLSELFTEGRRYLSGAVVKKGLPAGSTLVEIRPAGRLREDLVGRWIFVFDGPPYESQKLEIVIERGGD